MSDRKFTIVVDFDDTLFQSLGYPAIGPMVPGAHAWMVKWSLRSDICVIVWTNRDGAALADCEDHLWERKIPYSMLNPPREVWPCSLWNRSPKLYGDIVIDDRAACVPLWTPEGFSHPVVDWLIVGPYTEAKYYEWKRNGGNGVPNVIETLPRGLRQPHPGCVS